MEPKSSSTRTARLGLRASLEQERMLRRAADVSNKSLTEFILESACQAAERTLLDQRLFIVPDAPYQALMDMLERPARGNAGLKKLFAKPAPWEKR